MFQNPSPMIRYSFAILVLLSIAFNATSQVYTGDTTLNWDQEPNYEGIIGYDENPYDNKRKTYAAEKLPANYFQITTPEHFDNLWDKLGDPEYLNRFLTSEAGDVYDLESDGNFGTMWKAAHDGSNLYVLIKKIDLARISRPNLTVFNIFTQPTAVHRHEPTFQAGVQNNDMARKNMAYGRFVELGGGMANFHNGSFVSVFATVGLYGSFGQNYNSHYSLQEQDHYWDESEQFVRAMIIMPFDGALAYPDNWGELVSVKEGSIIAFDITSSGMTRTHNPLEYAWSADNPMLFYSNYYVGRLEILPEIKHAISIISEPEHAGIVKGAGNYRLRENVVVEAKANDGWFFSKWTLGDKLISLKSNYAFTMPAEDLILTAHFSDKSPRMTFEIPTIDLALISGETITQDLVFSNNGDNGSELIVQISSFSGNEQVTGNWLTIQPVVLEISSEEKKTEVLFNTEQLVEGIYWDTLLLMSNDPDLKRIEIPVRLAVTGIPAIGVLTDEIDFGTISTGASITRSLVISNPGTGPLELESIEVENTAFSVSIYKMTIAPKSSEKIHVTFGPGEIGDYSGNLKITSNTDDNPLINIPIKSKVMNLNVTFVIAEQEGGFVQDAEILILQGDQVITSGTTDSKGECNFKTLFSGNFDYKIRKYGMEVIYGNLTLTDSPVSISSTASYLPLVILRGPYSGNWQNEPEHAQKKGYHENPYDEKRKHYTALKLQGDYFKNFTDESFNLLWEIAGEAEKIDRIISGIDNQMQFNAQWKALHDGSKLYVFLKMVDPDQLANPYQGEFQVMVQTNQIYRHEPTFQSGLQYNSLWRMNEAYGRYLELGGGYILMQSGLASYFHGYLGVSDQWGLSEPNSIGLWQDTHYWHKDGRNINSILVLDFDQTLSYPVNPSDMTGERIGVKEDQTISFDVNFSTQAEYSDIMYYWSSESGNGWMSNYYSGHLHISAVDLTATQRVLSLTSNQGGIVSGDGTYDWGEEVTVIATPSDGWKFVHWKKNGTVISRENPYNFNLYLDTELIGIFTNEWPEISVIPDSIVVALDSGDSTEREIVITNNGNIPLDFLITIKGIDSGNKHKSQEKIEEFKDLSITEEEDTHLGIKTVDKKYGGPDDFGYRWIDSDDPNGPTFVWHSIENTGTLLSTVSGCEDCNQEVDLSFDFPFYGNKYKKIWVDANGYVSLTNTMSNHSSRELPSVEAPPAIIAGYWMNLCPRCNYNSKILFEEFEHMVIIQYQNIRARWNGHSATFQIQLHRSGEIKLFYLSAPTYQVNYSIGIQNQSRDKGLTVPTTYLGYLAIRIATAPSWISNDLYSGTLEPGENYTINLSLDATGLTDGLYESTLNIQSNDPESPMVIVPITMNVTGYPAIEISDHTIDFGISGLGHQVQFPLTITNPGGAALEISQIEIDNPGFSIPYSELIIPPFESRIIQVSFLGEEAITYEGALTFNTNVEHHESVSIPLKAEVLKLDVLFKIENNEIPIQGAVIKIEIYQTDNTIYTGITDEAGILLVENLYPGTFTYMITKNGFRGEAGLFVITDHSTEISISIIEQYVKIYINSTDTVFETGKNDIIPVHVEMSGYSMFKYYLYLINNGNWIYITQDNIHHQSSATIPVTYQIDTFDPSGTYKFVLMYDVAYPYSYGERIFTSNVEVVNHNELIEIINPQSYNTYTVGSSVLINWKSINVSTVNISYSIDNENTWQLIESNINSPDSYYGNAENNIYWDIPSDLVDVDKQCKIRIESSINTDIFDITDAFTLRAAPVKILSPTSNTVIYVGERLDVILDVKRASWLYFNVLDENSNYILEFPSGYHNVGIQALSFTQTQNLKPDKNQFTVYHNYERIYCFGEYFNVLPATGLHYVSYIIDMSQAKINGTKDFNPEDHDLYISGSFQDKWAMPGSIDRYKMTPIGSNKYQVNLNTPPGEILYSFFIVPKNGDPTWDHAESDTINCRVANINQAMELQHVWMNYPVYELKLEVAPPEAGLVFGDGFRPSGHFTSISTIPHSNYKFINWTSGNQQVLSDSPELEFRMPPGNVTYTANYNYILNAGAIDHAGAYLYPNPANDKVKIMTLEILSEISITDNLGRLILSRKGAFGNETELDISFMNPGVYVVRLTSDTKTEYMKLQVVK